VMAPNPLLSLTPRSNFPMSSDDRSVMSTCPPSKLALAWSQRVCRSGTYRTCLGFYAFYATGAGAYVSDVVAAHRGTARSPLRSFVEDHRAAFDVSA
jgi:hypothetical protein